MQNKIEYYVMSLVLRLVFTSNNWQIKFLVLVVIVSVFVSSVIRAKVSVIVDYS